MNSFNPPSFGKEIDRLLAPPRLNELGPGKPNAEMGGELESLSGLPFGNWVVNHDMASACLAGLWLYHDFLDESHAVSQQIETREGSYWHGILHRREPDYANAKYWFRRVGDHPIGGQLSPIARELALSVGPDKASQFLVDEPHWDHFRFVDLCQAAAAGKSQSEVLCRQIQQREWWLLFAYCFERSCSGNTFR